MLSSNSSGQSMVKLLLTFSSAVSILFIFSIIIYALVNFIEIVSIGWVIAGAIVSLLTSLNIFRYYLIHYILPDIDKSDKKDIKNNADETPRED